MNKLQFTAQDYSTYLQMSNHKHILVESDLQKGKIERLLKDFLLDNYLDMDIDDIEHLIYFEHPYRSEEKIGQMFSNIIRSPHAYKLVTVLNERPENFDPNRVPRLLSINDDLSIAERTTEVINKFLSGRIKATSIPKVRDYLLQHIDLIDLLPFIIRVTSESFGTDTQLSLELYHDPEVEDMYLAFFARNERYDENFLEVIKHIRASYTDLLTGKSGWILVATDFDAPRQGE